MADKLLLKTDDIQKMVSAIKKYTKLDDVTIAPANKECVCAIVNNETGEALKDIYVVKFPSYLSLFKQ